MGPLFGEVISPNIGIILLLTGITCARFGLWIADMGVNQMIQTEVKSPPMVSSVQTSLNIVMELIKFVIVLFVSDVNNFYILSIMSYLATSTGAIIFALYVLKIRNNNFINK